MQLAILAVDMMSEMNHIDFTEVPEDLGQMPLSYNVCPSNVLPWYNLLEAIPYFKLGMVRMRRFHLVPPSPPTPTPPLSVRERGFQAGSGNWSNYPYNMDSGRRQ